MKHLCFQESNASIGYSKYIDVKQNRHVNATVYIKNASDFISSIEIRGTPGFKFDIDRMEWLFDFKTFKTRSYALICTEQNAKQLHQKRRIFEYGSRFNGDFLVHFQTEAVSKNSLNKILFNFRDSQVNISYLAIDSDVSN